MTADGRRRGLLAALLLGIVAVIGVALSLEPDPRGYGTHEALGLPPCGLVFLTRGRVPCPSCGMTTSFAHAARLQLADSFRAHPFGLVLFGSMVFAGLLSAAGLAGSRGAERLERWVNSLPWWLIGVTFFGLFFLFWGYRVWRGIAWAGG